MDENDILWKSALGVETDPVYDDLFLLELEFTHASWAGRSRVHRPH